MKEDVAWMIWTICAFLLVVGTVSAYVEMHKCRYWLIWIALGWVGPVALRALIVVVLS